MKQLDPKAVWLFFFSFLPRIFIFLWLVSIFATPFLGFLVIPNNSENMFFVYVGTSLIIMLLWVLILLVLNYVWAKLSYKFYKYELADLGFKKESGVIYKKYVTIPYDRIQNVDINRGIFARILHLSDLQIQTAGSSGTAGSEGRLPGLSVASAEELRDELIKRAHQLKDKSGV